MDFSLFGLFGVTDRILAETLHVLHSGAIWNSYLETASRYRALGKGQEKGEKNFY